MAFISKRQQLATEKADEDNNNPLTGITPAQAATWIDNNVNDLATAKTALKWLSRVVIRHERRLNELDQ